MVPGLVARAPLGVEYDPARLTLDQYAAAVLDRYYRAMLNMAETDSRALLVSYDEGFPAAFERVTAWLGLALDDRQHARVKQRCGADAKNPRFTFNRPDAAPITEVDVGPLRALFDRLEVRRRTASAETPAV